MIWTTTRIMYCLALFCFASWLSSVLAKAVSTHFYKTTHFRKIQFALEKEYFLQVSVGRLLLILLLRPPLLFYFAF